MKTNRQYTPMSETPDTPPVRFKGTLGLPAQRVGYVAPQPTDGMQTGWSE